jgi:hypothetical protein
MGVLCRKKVFVAMLLIVLIAGLHGQWAEIIEDFIPNDCVPFAVKQGSDGNLYMTMLDYSNPPQITIAFCITDLHGQVLNYYSATQDEMNEMGAEYYDIPRPAFTLDPDNTIRFPYKKTIQISEYEYEAFFCWAFYNQATGLTFQQGQGTFLDIDGIENLIQINTDRWLVVKRDTYEPCMFLIDSEGSDLWHGFVVPHFNRNQYVQKLDDSSFIINTNDGNFQMRTTIKNFNGYGLWQQVTELPVSIYGFEVNVYKYLDNGSALIMYYSGLDSLTYTFLYNDYSLTEFFPPTNISFWGYNNSCCDEYGLLFGCVERYSKYNTQGNLLWQYTLPDSFRCGDYRSQLVHIPEDSCYVTIGYKTDYTPYLLRLHYGSVSNSDGVEPVTDVGMRVYPNPFGSSINLEIKAREAGQAEVIVCNIKGQLVRSLGLRNVKSGINLLSWDGKDSSDSDTVRGLYFIKVKTSNQILIRKCLKI